MNGLQPEMWRRPRHEAALAKLMRAFISGVPPGPFDFQNRVQHAPRTDLDERTVQSGQSERCAELTAAKRKATDGIEQHDGRAAVVLVVVEDALPHLRVSRLAPSVIPFDRRRAGWVGVAPVEAQVLGE
jgi:hypothetical protein